MKNKYFTAILLLNIIFHALTLVAQNPKKVDSLLNIIKSSKQDTTKVLVYNSLFGIYEFEDTAKAHLYIKKGLSLAEEINYKKGLAISLTNTGFYNEDMSNYSEAIDYSQKSCAVWKEMNRKDMMARCYTNTGNVYYFLGNYLKAAENYQLSFKMSEELGDKRGMARNYCNLGLVHSFQNDYKKSIDHSEKGIKIFREILSKATEEDDIVDLKMAIANTLNNVAINYEKQNEFDKAVKTCQEARVLFQEINDKHGIASTSINLGDAYGGLKNYKLSEQYFTEALKLNEALGNKAGIASCLSNISAIYNLKKQFNKAIELADKALVIAKEINSLEKQKQAYIELFYAYKGLKQFEKSLEYHELYMQFQDSIFSTEKFNQISRMEAIYENDKQHKEIELLNKDKELQETELQTQRLQKFAFIGGFVLMILFSFVVYRGYRNKRKANILLETQKQEIAEKNEELYQQNEEISAQRDEIENQKHLIEYKQKETLDSIYYARRIQRALLASEDLLSKHLKDYFIYFQPKDIVSGDFYWAAEGGRAFMLCTADSTGHGVPGAIMSMLNISCLNEAVNAQKLVEPNEILNFSRSKIIQHLANDGSAEGGKDGMDCSLIVLDRNAGIIKYSGANNPVWIVRKSQASNQSELIEIIPNKMPVGKHDKDAQSFEQQIIPIQQGDVIYTLTDGYADQFGGVKGKKFMYKQLKALLLGMSELPMQEQKEKLDAVFQTWKGNLEQIDDVLLIGVRV